MHFAYPLAWWTALLLVTLAGVLAFAEYRRPLVPLTVAKRATLIALRAVVLLLLLAFVFRPVILLPPHGSRDAIVPVVVDASRSMRLHDAEGESRIARASALLNGDILPALQREFRPELFTVGEQLTPADAAKVATLAADAQRTNLADAIAAVRERYRGQRVAGIVLLSDGGETGRPAASISGDAAAIPVFAVGIGSPDGLRDREVVGITAGDPRLDQASVDLHVTAISSGFGRTPFQVRLLANGQLLEARRVVPSADGSPIDEAFTVSPDPLAPTVYTAEIPADDAEAAAENNHRSVLVNPAGRKRRVLVLEGAPGFEHSFMTRALARDPGLEIDSIVRKGKNAEGQDTFFVQAGQGRTSALLTGFPARREDLYAYDALVLANMEGDFFTRAQLAMTADFVAERGGGLLVLGGRSFTQRGLTGTPLETALPVELGDRRGALVRTALERTGAADVAAGAPNNKLVVTPEGEVHPIMRIGANAAESRKLWAALPPLASSAPLGGPRAGATVLAVTTTPAGGLLPVVAVQRYGQGRSMIFAGEASWRWKMMASSTDRSYEFFWRQAARWLAGPSPDPIEVRVTDSPEPREPIDVSVDARDAAFAPVADATVAATLTVPGGETHPVALRSDSRGRYAGSFTAPAVGLYRLHADARRGSTSLGAADKWFYVGTAEREFADPRLNEPFLRRMARETGGRYVRAADARRVLAWLRDAVPQTIAPERRDLWHRPSVFAVIILLLSGEWILRRRWGLR